MNQSLSSKGNPRRLLSFGLLFAGCILLCNPNINLYDLLPDSIGYFLLMLALRHTGDIFPHFADAYRKFRILFWTNLAKFPAIIIMVYITGHDMDERSIITVFALAFAAIELIFALPAFRALFEGLVYIGEREGVFCTLGSKSTSVDGLTLLTIIFLIIKHALSFLPELVYLSTFFYTGSLEPNAVDPITFYPVLTLFSLTLGTVLGLVWLFKMRPYLLSMRKDEQMDALLARKYVSCADALGAADLRRRQLTFLTLIFAGFFFAVDPTINNSDALPNVISALLFFFAFFFLEDKRKALYGKIMAGLYAASSIAHTSLASAFFEEFELTDIAYREEPEIRYIPVVITNIFENIFFFLTVFFLLYAVREFIMRYTGKDLRPTDTALRNEIQTGLCKKNNRVLIFSALYALMRPVCTIMMTITDRHEITPEEANQYYAAGTPVYEPRFAWLWILVLICGAALAVYVFSLIHDMKEEAGLTKEE